MNIVIVGARDRNSADDLADVKALLSALEARYGNFVVLSVMSHAGIGKLVRDECSKPCAGRLHRFPFVEMDIHIYAKDLTRDAMAQFYTSRNAMLFETGDLFFSFPHPQRRQITDELIHQRVIPAQRPYQIFLPGDPIDVTI